MLDTPRSRRRVLGLAGAAAVGGVLTSSHRRRTAPAPLEAHATSGPRPPTATIAPSTTAPPTTTASTTEPPQEVVVWQPPPGEVEVEAKATAAAVAQLLTTHDRTEALESLVDRTMAGSTGRADLVSVQRAAAELHLPGRRVSGTVVYPQLGGLAPHHAPTACSVMVVVEQRGDGPAVQRCLDIRLELVGDRWDLVSVEDVSGRPLDRPPSLSATAGDVLDHPSIQLPDSARWDLHEGRIDDRVLSELLVLADQVDVAVASVCRGHPEHVFGTARRSAHMAGRAIDVWMVDEPVVSQRQVGSTAHRMAKEVFARGRITNFGSPWAFDPPGGRSFTDPVHADHFHLAV